MLSPNALPLQPPLIKVIKNHALLSLSLGEGAYSLQEEEEQETKRKGTMRTAVSDWAYRVWTMRCCLLLCAVIMHDGTLCWSPSSRWFGRAVSK